MPLTQEPVGTINASVSEIQDQFNRILEYTQGYSIVSDELFEQWWKNKERFRKRFGPSLIKNLGHVEFHLSDKEKESLINQFLELAGCELADTQWANFQQFIQSNEASFFDNIVSCVTLPGYADFKLGMKLVKAFKFFINDPMVLRRLQEYASSIIQKEKMSGDFCVSIHPLDFLTSSVNTYNWRSCHALDGEYRAGNLSYMADNVTFMCYIKGEAKLQYPFLPNGITWNSKKWRMFVYIDPTDQMCFLGRQYPYALSHIDELIHDKILPASPLTWTPFTDSYVSSFHTEDDILPLSKKYYCLERCHGLELFPLRTLVRDTNPHDPLHFNDLLFSHCYKPMYSSRYVSHCLYHDDNNDVPLLEVGADVKCMHCGQDYIYAESNSMLCKDCAIDMEVIDPPDEDDYYEYDDNESEQTNLDF